MKKQNLIIGVGLALALVLSAYPQEVELWPGEKLVAWDRLEVGKRYRLLNGVELEHHRNLRLLGPYYAPTGSLIRVRRVDRSEPENPWYSVLYLKLNPQTANENIPGWLNGEDIKEKGVVEPPYLNPPDPDAVE